MGEYWWSTFNDTKSLFQMIDDLVKEQKENNLNG